LILLDQSKNEQTAASHNSTNHDTPFAEKDYCDRSIVFAAEKLVVRSGKNNGVVYAHVMRHVAGTTDWNPEINICPRHERLTGESPALASDVIERPFPFGLRSLDGCVRQGKLFIHAKARNHRVLSPDVPRTFASLMSVRGMGAGFALVPQADVRFANVAELRESTQYVCLRALRKQRSCSHALRCSRAHYTQRAPGGTD